jgi:NitT/TauT family transport system substrate-binding protein
MKIKPAGKAVIALIVIGACVGVYFKFIRGTVQDNAAVTANETATNGGDTAKSNVASGNAGVVKEVEVAKVDPKTNEVVKDEAGKPVVEVRKEKVYTVALSEWPGHMAGVIACNGLTTQPGSYCSTVRSSDPNDSPGIQIQFKFIEDPAAKNEALQSGEVDFVWQTVDEMPLNMPGYTKSGVEAQAFVQIDWSRGGDACIAANGIKSPRDLLNNGKGAAMMMFTPDHTVYEFWINNSDLTPAEVNKLRASTKFHATDPAFGRNLFVQGKVDVACLWEPDVSLALRGRPGSYRVFSTKDASTLVADVLLARKDFLAKQPFVAEKVARIFIEGGKIGRANLPAAARLVSSVVPRFRDELKYDATLEAFGWVRWNDLGDNVGLFGLNGSEKQFDVVYKQADSIWSEYQDPTTGDPVLPQRFSPHTLRTAKILAPVYAEAEAERASAAKVAEAKGQAAPAPIAPEKPVYKPEVAKTGEAKLVKPVALYFDTGVHGLDPAARSILSRQVVDQLQLAQGMYVRIEGNTDDVGSSSVNEKLSARRAESVAEFLVQQGIDSNRIASKGNGENNPVCNLKTEDCRSRNRRTDIIFVSAQ